MKIDESIVQLGAELDEWFDRNRATFASQDRSAQGKSLIRGFEIAKELDRVKADGLAAIATLLDYHEPVASEERIASLVRGFEFAAKLADTLYDELLDTDGGNKITALMNDIAGALDGMGAGRASLAVLLHSPDARVRASAGAYLIKLMPDRVLPILREIEEGEEGSSAGFHAHWALLRWQQENKVRDK
jgi:hypothetical protein